VSGEARLVSPIEINTGNIGAATPEAILTSNVSTGKGVTGLLAASPNIPSQHWLSKYEASFKI
jgi:hypothetical protein